MTTRRSLLFGIITIFIGGASALALGEVVCREFGLSITWRQREHLTRGMRAHDALGKWRPSSMWVSTYGVTYNSNSQGFRDREFAPNAGFGITRIALVGDSVTEGLGVEPRERFGEALVARLAPGRVDVLNFGISGFSTLHERELLAGEVFRYGPKIVVLQVGSNDLVDNAKVLAAWAATRQANPPDPGGRGRRTFLQEYSALYLFLAERTGWLQLRLGTRSTILRRLHELPDEDYELLASLLKQIRDLCHRNDAQLYIAYFPLQAEVVIKNRNVAVQTANKVRRIAEGLGTEGVDVLEPLWSHAECDAFIDDVHLSPCGHRIVAEVLAGAIGRSRALAR